MKKMVFEDLLGVINVHNSPSASASSSGPLDAVELTFLLGGVYT